MAPPSLVSSLHEKVREQLRTLRRLSERVPESALSWRPGVAAKGRALRRTDELLGHLIDAVSGFCAVLHALFPERLAHLARLRERGLDRPVSGALFRRELDELEQLLAEGFALLEDRDLARLVPTAFVPEGETVLSLLLGNLEHVVSHRQQLFDYLRLRGEDVGTADLYRLRAGAEPREP